MRALLAAAFATQAIAFLPAHADDRSRQATDTRDKTSELEKAFWVCDYAGTNGTASGDQAMMCVAITDELKRTRFDGDFEALVAWWRLNKAARHHELERVRIAKQ